MSLNESKRKRLIDKHLESEAERKASELERKDEVEKAKALKEKKD